MTAQAFPWKGQRLGRLIVTTCRQGHGAPWIDDAWTNDREGNTYVSKAILLWPFGNRNRYGERRPRRALVIGWRR